MELIDLFFATQAEQELAEPEADKLARHIRHLSPGFQVEIILRHGEGVRRCDGGYFGVYNAPFRSGACSITITLDEEWTNQGTDCCGFYRGDSQAHLRGGCLVRAGDRSVDISIHEWLHFYAGKTWGINVDDPDYDYPGKNLDSAENGWRHWYTALLGDQRPQRLALGLAITKGPSAVDGGS